MQTTRSAPKRGFDGPSTRLRAGKWPFGSPQCKGMTSWGLIYKT